MTAPTITDVCFVAAPTAERGRGLLGFVSLVIDGRIRLDGLTLRRTQRGRLTLSYPERRDRSGGVHPYIHPIGDETRLALECEVFEALGLATGEASP